jgi:GPH family glycoside/pentoside/hexuronide:cation symporter
LVSEAAMTDEMTLAGAPLQPSLRPTNWLGRKIPWSVLGGFALVPLAHSAGMNIVTLLAFRFFTDNLAISAAAAGALFAAVKLYDGLLDPALGAFSDRTKSPWGRRLPYLLAGGVLMPLAVVMVFNPPQFASLMGVEVFLAIALILHSTAYTALTIPGMAMLVEASDDYHERSKLMSFRVLGNSLGVLLGATLPALLLARWGATRAGHGHMALVIGGLLLIVGVVAVVLLRTTPRTTPVAGKAYRFFDQFKLAWANRPFRILAITHVFILLGTVVTSIANAYFNRYVLLVGDGWLGTYYLIATVGSVGSMPLWLRFSKAYGKKAGYILSMAGFGIFNLSWLLAHAHEPYTLLVARALIIGVFSGGMILFAYSMLSDAVRYDFIQTGLRREGGFAGFTSLIDKLSAAVGVAGVGYFLSRMGYTASTAGAAAVQPHSAILAIYLSFAVAPALAMAAGIAVMTTYRLDEAALREETSAA